MAELEILIKTRTELAGAQQAAQSLEKLIGAAKVSGKPFADMEAQLARMRGPIDAFKQSHSGLGDAMAGVNEKLREVVPGFGKLQDVFTALTSGAMGYVTAALLAVGAAAKVAAAGVRAYAEAEERVTKLDAALAQTGQLTEGYREKLQGLAIQLADTTAIADEEWLSALARLTQFGAKPENIDKYAEAVKNLAGIMGGDIQSAAVAMSRAMGGSFTMFSRLGIHIDDTKGQAEKLAELFKKLADVGGGQLEASTRTLAGQYRFLKMQMGEVFEGIGGFIARTGVLQAVLDATGTAVRFFAEALGRVTPNVAGLVNAAERTTRSVDDAGGAMGRGKTAADSYAEALKKASDELAKVSAQEESRLSFQEKLDAINMRTEISASDATEKNPVKRELAKAKIIQKYADRDFERRDESKEFVQANIGAQAAAIAKDIASAEADKKRAAAYDKAAAPAVAARVAEREDLLKAEEVKRQAGYAKTMGKLGAGVTGLVTVGANAMGLPVLAAGATAITGEAPQPDGDQKSLEASARTHRKEAQDVQARIGQPPKPTAPPGVDIGAARTRFNELTGQYETIGTEREREAELYGAQRKQNLVTTGKAMVDIKPVKDAVDDFTAGQNAMMARILDIMKTLNSGQEVTDKDMKAFEEELKRTNKVGAARRNP